jgi:hypothetical protein
MINRYSTAPAETGDEAEGRRTKPTTPYYVFLPNALLRDPPIRHRGEHVEVGLSVFEFAIAGACAILARQKIASIRHDHAFGRGGEAIRGQRKRVKLAVQYGQDPAQLIKDAGSYSYSDAKLAFDSTPSEKSLTIELSITKLLRIANVSRKSDNWARLDTALQRLTEPTGSFAPALRTWKRLANGKLRLKVDPKWVPQGRYTRVVWPLPTGGPTILALYLFLSFVSVFDRRRSTDISTEALYRRLGIPLSRPAHAERSLNNALGRVNAHYRRHSATITELALPRGWKIEPVAGGTRVHFTYIGATQGAKDQDDDFEVEGDDDLWAA